MRLTNGSRQARFTLALDVTAIVVFISFGMEAHADAGAASIFLRNFIPFTAAWLATAWFTGTYRPPTPRALIVTLLIAIPCGVLLRVAWVRSSSAAEVVTFMVVALVFASIFVGIGRLVAATVGARLFGDGS
jgi:Protein of unknown function (DUF3054)